MRFMLDTNTVSYLLRDHPSVTKHVVEMPMSSLCISVITEAELLFGLAKRPEAIRLKKAVSEFLKRVEVLPWDRAAAECYGTIRAKIEGNGKTIAALDLLIGSHALSSQMTLITNDRVFAKIDGLKIADWTA
jgi:tRNA(fMet)-specific endonuclease VapC